MLLSETLDLFLLSLEANGRKPRTLDSYRQRITGFLGFLTARGISQLETLSPELLDAWVVALRRQGQRYADHGRRPQETGALSPTTIAGRIQAVRTWLDWCVERGYLDLSPARHLKRPRVTRSTRSRVMQVEDLRAMEAAAERMANEGRPRDLALLSFLADTGCRRGELVSLRIANLDLENGEALVSGKTAERIVDFGQRTAAALRVWLDVRPETDHDFVFVDLTLRRDRRGRPLGVAGVYQVLKRLAKMAGIQGRFNPHSIRHLVGQHFTDQANLELARQKLGHRDIKTTADFYANQDRERVKRASRRLSLMNHLDEDD